MSKTQDNDGQTPLMLAAEKNTNPKVTETLLDGKADAKIQNNNGQTALTLADKNPKIKDSFVRQKLQDALFS